jgi:hypothetical protein
LLVEAGKPGEIGGYHHADRKIFRGNEGKRPSGAVGNAVQREHTKYNKEALWGAVSIYEPERNSPSEEGRFFTIEIPAK